MLRDRDLKIEAITRPGHVIVESAGVPNFEMTRRIGLLNFSAGANMNQHRRLPETAEGVRPGGQQSSEASGTMNRRKRQALQAVGVAFENAEDFLAFTVVEHRLVDLPLAVSRVVRRRREHQHLSQEKLAKEMKSSQSRVAKLKAGAADVSPDRLTFVIRS